MTKTFLNEKKMLVLAGLSILTLGGLFVFNYPHEQIAEAMKNKVVRTGVHKDITTTYFWIGESAGTDNKNITNTASAWDENWIAHFGGIDDPNRTTFLPTGFIPKENPFYVALPYNDFNANGNRRSNAKLVPWFGSKVWKSDESVVKNSWVKITKNGKTVYAQWEDVGPLGENDFNYVFGSAQPKSNFNRHAGLDVSPAVKIYLELKDIDKTSWQFVNEKDVPAGPWKEVVTTSQVDWNNIDGDLPNQNDNSNSSNSNSSNDNSNTNGNSNNSNDNTSTTQYPIHKSINTTYFWVGEPSGPENANIPNDVSAWDEDWMNHFGGVDDPNNRNGYFPAKFTPKENPFYVALPYNDFNENGVHRADVLQIIPWAKEKIWKADESICKNRWVKIMKNGKVSYGQWEDVGPMNEDDSKYVFGTATPRSSFNNHAGLDVSPAIHDMLKLGDIDKTDWQFVDEKDVPAGPWKQIITTSQVNWN